ncbi:WecB/TagA/CpsF family glycosyltransferase [Roseofilum casamattae]|uniref:WecB/TagA/CpsF family glycosyltransferase n=1 Tax=Roseofilum casamattae BLCC-M143 TaxID=3022442 RepID=A0ABT7BVF6_9CYAN|nr:WecB/TagA/CpsF family glycosyltransferase [Roseofilum casamattae]MDJ1183178.1 WecB/TagA/CpsF family glycosyltransferase [Roseofilum casamattae BLCC-M143]
MDNEDVAIAAPQMASVMDLPVRLDRDYPGWLLNHLNNRWGVHVVTLNAEMTMQARENPALAETIRNADLVIPDGAGVVLHLQWQGYKIERCPGIELAENLLCGLAEQTSTTTDACHVFFYGGEPGVAADAMQIWQEKCPTLSFSSQHGYLNSEEEKELQATLKTEQPQLIYVGLGVPRQEFWIAKHRDLCPESIWIGVGGSFDIWAGRKDRAPAWLRDRNLEWVYRLYQEPSRWRRMLALPRFAWLSLTQSL